MDTVTSVASAPHARAPGLLSEKLSYPTPSPLLFMLQLPPSVPPPQPPGLLHLLRVPPCSDRAGGHGDGPLGLKGRTRSPPLQLPSAHTAPPSGSFRAHRSGRTGRAGTAAAHLA